MCEQQTGGMMAKHEQQAQRITERIQAMPEDKQTMMVFWAILTLPRPVSRIVEQAFKS
jgi:hypothetical protein